MYINLELYRVFIKVAQNKSFTLASQELGISQSAVSQSIAQLEGLLGSKLFVRGQKGADLTPEGQVLFGHVGGLLGGINMAETYFSSLKDLKAGSLAIGASDTLCRHLLLSRLQDFHARYPNVALNVTNRTSVETLDLLRKGVVEIGFVSLPLEKSGDFALTPIMPLHDCFVAKPDYFAGSNRPKTASELQNFPLIMLEKQSAGRAYLDGWLAANGGDIRPQIELGSLDLAADFAEKGLGIAAVVKEYISAQIAGGRLKIIELQEKIPPRQAALITKKGVPLSKAAETFVKLLMQSI